MKRGKAVGVPIGRTWRFPVLALAGLVLFSSDTAEQADASEKSYRVRTFVPSQVGSRRSVRKRGTQSVERVVKKEGKVVWEEQSIQSFEFEGRIEVLEVNRRGAESKLLITVIRYVLTPDKGRPQEICSPDTLVIAQTEDDETVYRAKRVGEALSDLALESLPRIVTTDTGGKEIDDRIFKITRPQQVGASWLADKRLLLRKFGGMAPRLDPSSVSGAGRLLGVKTIKGVHHLEIELALSVRATGHPEPGVIPVKLTVEATQQITIPADYSTGPVTRREEVTMEQSFRGKPGTENEGLVMEGRSWDSAITQTRYVN